MFNVSVVEARDVISAIYDRYGFDITSYTMSSLRLRIGRILHDHNLLCTNELISRLLEDPEFLDIFLKDTSVGSPDLFRDPDLWIEIRDKLIPQIFQEHQEFEILVPSSVTGDELYSLAILLKESGWTRKIRLQTTCLNNEIIDSIRNGVLSQMRFKTSADNYRIFNPDGNLDEYLYNEDGKVFKSPELLKQVKFLIKKPTAVPINNRTRLILFRNRLLYVNPGLKTKIIKGISDRMPGGSFLILGIRESLEGNGHDNSLNPVSRELNIYEKAKHE